MNLQSRRATSAHSRAGPHSCPATRASSTRVSKPTCPGELAAPRGSPCPVGRKQTTMNGQGPPRRISGCGPSAAGRGLPPQPPARPGRARHGWAKAPQRAMPACVEASPVATIVVAIVFTVSSSWPWDCQAECLRELATMRTIASAAGCLGARTTVVPSMASRGALVHPRPAALTPLACLRCAKLIADDHQTVNRVEMALLSSMRDRRCDHGRPFGRSVRLPIASRAIKGRHVPAFGWYRLGFNPIA